MFPNYNPIRCSHHPIAGWPDAQSQIPEPDTLTRQQVIIIIVLF